MRSKRQSFSFFRVLLIALLLIAFTVSIPKVQAADAANLVQDKITIELPADVNQKKEVSVLLPANAAGSIVTNNLDLFVKGSDVSFTLPPEVLKAVLDASTNVSQIELSTEKVDPANLTILKDAAVISNKVMAFDINAVTGEGKKEKPSTNFPKNITVTMSLEGVDTTKVNTDKLAVYKQEQDNSWKYVGSILSSDQKSMSFEAGQTGIYALMEFKKTFKDIKGHWAEKDIELMAMRLIAKGFNDHTFAPDKNLTRAQFAAFLIKTLGIPEENQQQPTFKDVTPHYWGYKAVEAAYKAGLIKGTGAGKFEPERNITREEITAMLFRALSKSNKDVTLTDTQVKEILGKYSDSTKISEWAKSAVAMCIEKGIISGRTPMTIVPLSNATRAEAIVMLKKLL